MDTALDDGRDRGLEPADGRFALGTQQVALLERARRLGRDVFEPIAEAGPQGRVNRALVRALGDHGLLGRLFPTVSVGDAAGAEQPDGGPAAAGSRSAEVSATDLCLLREGLAYSCVEAETALALQGLGAYPLLQSGSPELARRWMRPVAAGTAVAAFALSEPDAGSDAASLALRADAADGGYRLSGRKQWISNAPDADVYTVFGRTTADAGARGVTAFAVPGDSPGLSGTRLSLLAPHAIGTLEFDDVFVPADSVLGEVDRGFRVAMRTLDLFRPSVGAFAVGMAQSALDAACTHADRRSAFGGVLRDLQAVAHKLADMATRTHAARLLVYHAAGAYDAGGDGITKLSSMAKLYATEAAQTVVDDALQIHGAAGLETGHLLERLYREVRAPRIYEGTSEVQRSIIARELYR